MSKISYCSLEEAWGDAYKKNDEKSNNDINQEKNDDKYDYLNKMSQIERENVVENMNKIERNSSPENNSIVEYNKYRFNPTNKVNKSDYDQQNYTPFNESIEKKYLQDKLNFLENEFKKYKFLFENNETFSNKNINNEEDIYESFKNNEEDEDKSKNKFQYKSNDIIDIILLIIIGLIVIFVLNSIFSIGKVIGSRHKI